MLILLAEIMVETLRKHKAVLRLSLECQFGLIDELDSRFVLSDEELMDISSTGKNKGIFKENDELLRIMMLQTDVTKHDDFLSALIATSQQHLATYIINDGCKFRAIVYYTYNY